MTAYSPEGDHSSGRRLALDVILGDPAGGIPVWLVNPMEWEMIDRLAEMPAGSYRRNPVETYRRMLERSSCCMVDQWIPENPLTMRADGFGEDAAREATTGASTVVRDSILIDSPEAVVRHLEDFESASVRAAISAFDENALVASLIECERSDAAAVGPGILKAPYTNPFARFPVMHYGLYGYEQYFMAYALYPEVMARYFSLAADYAVLHNRAAVRAIREADLPPFVRIDHDITDSRGTLADVSSLDRVYFPHLARCMEPFVSAGISLVWHCDGNVMPLVPRLLDMGFDGFQGFQYEDGVDYPAICRMKPKSGREILIIGGVSVTRTLPYGKPDDVRHEMKWLVDNCSSRRLFLGASSSIAPGVPWENLKTLVEGFRHYREHGRRQAPR